jgi:methionyl-tRNA formyltransferase
MKTGFFGTPEIAAYYLERLSETHDVLFAVTGIDKPRGRHGTPSFSPAKQIAVEKNIPVLQPEKLTDQSFMESLASFNADIFIVVAYGKIIPSAVFNMPRLKTINLHPSLLPKYRGAAPMQWALINGETESGITIQYINEKLDSGDIIVQKKLTIPEDITSEDFYMTILPEGFDLLQEALLSIESGIQPVKQNESDATYCGKIDRDAARIDWTKSAVEIHNLVRGLNPKPVAWTEFRGKNFKIYKSKVAKDIAGDSKPGFIDEDKKRILVSTGSGYLEILELQPEGKKIMDSHSFINGNRISKEDFFR